MSLANEIKSGRDLGKKKRWFWPRRRKLSLKRLSYDELGKKRKIKALVSYLVSLAVVLAIFGALFLLILFAWTAKDLPDPSTLLKRDITQTTTIYDREGKTLLYQLHGNVNRKMIKLSDLPDYVKWTSITAEDRDFYNHSGFSLRGMLRSFISNLFNANQVGGSTITQQFVKNAILTTEKTYTRKFKELILAYRIEQKFSKDEILQMYFNEIPYGSVIYGIEAASQSYFGKSAKDLTLAQAAVLAAMTQRPTYFSPYGNNVDRLMERQRYILNEMVTLRHITEAQGEAAKAEKIVFKPKQEAMIAPHFVMYVRELLADQFGERYAEESGLKVTTTLNADYQQKAEKAVTDNVNKNKDKWNAGNAALVALDTKTGQILAMVGSADFYNEEIDGQVNVAMRPRQPGSSFKPLAYLTAFSRGYTPETVLYDVSTVFKNTDGTDYAPNNYDSKEHGPVTMRQALAGSLNIPAVKTLYLAGIDNVLDNAEKLGYTTLSDRSRFGLSLVLGGGEVTPLEHTAAFAAYAQEGVYHKPLAILKIEDASGKVLYEYKENDNQGKKVFEPEPVRSLQSIMSDNAARAFIFGEKNYLTLPDRPVAAKTGTTNDYKDAWTMGYTPSLAAGVWVGNSNGDNMKRGADGSVVAAPIWNQFMREALAGTPVENFNPPPENTSTKPVLRGEAGVTRVKIDITTGKLATENTPPELIIEKTYSQFHDILYYVNKDDPQGPPPAVPFADGQFASWEDGVRAWAIKQGYSLTEQPFPTEYDDVHTPENKPTVSIIAPQNGATITNRNISVLIQTDARRGVKTVYYYLDNALIQTVTSAPWDLMNLDIGNVTSGIHTVSARAIDDVQNSTTASVDLNFLLQ